MLEEVEDWDALANWLNIKIAIINNIKKNCETFESAQCKWRQLVRKCCDKNDGDPYETAEAIAYKLESKMDKKTTARKLKELVFTSEFRYSVYSLVYIVLNYRPKYMLLA